MIKRVLIIGVITIAVSLVLKCEQAIGLSIESIPCIKTWGEDMKVVDRDWKASCEKQILVFSVENDKITSEFKSDSNITFFFPEDWLVGMAYCFSDEELADIIDQDLFKAGVVVIFGFEVGTLIMSVYSAESETGVELLDLLFTPTEDYIIMENPATGEDIYLNGVDYIKFRGSPLVPVPPLLN